MHWLLSPLLVFSFLIAIDGVRADTFVVDDTGDDPGDCSFVGQCTLRAAVAAANASVGPDTIELTQGETYLLGQQPAAGIDVNSDTVQIRVVDAGGQIVASPLDTSIDAAGVGRAFQISLGATLDISGLTVRNGDIAADGGGIVVRDGGTLVFADAILTGNEAATGGGLAVRGPTGQATLMRVLVSGNVVSADQGGGIWNDGTLTLTDVTVSGNHGDALALGGGIYNVNPGTLVMTGGAVVRNAVTANGGGLWNGGPGPAGDQLDLSGTFIHSNAAGNAGGGLFNDTGQLRLEGVSIRGNVGGGDGGGVRNEDGDAMVMGSVIAENTSTRLNGGGIALGGVSMPTLIILDTDILSNTAPVQSGGGIAVIGTGGTLNLIGSLVDDNTAFQNGGGIHARAGSDLSLLGSTLTNNRVTDGRDTGAGNGGAAYISGAGLLEVLESDISFNTAGLRGAGMYVQSSTSVRIADTNLSDNRVTSPVANNGDGGGLNLNNNSGVEIVRSTIARNSAEDDGGGLFVFAGGSLDILNSTISGNSAGSEGGALFVQNATTLTNVTLAANSAAAGEVFRRSGGALNLFSSIIEHDPADGVDVCSGAISSSDFNLLESGSGGTSCNLAGSNDFTVAEVSIGLQPLSFNGGPFGLETHALAASSFAIDRADDARCDTGDPDTALDNRSAPRRVDGNGDSTVACDIGAYEFGSVPVLDTDRDGVADAEDNCRFTPNPDQSDVGGIGSAPLTAVAVPPHERNALVGSIGSAARSIFAVLFVPATAHAQATGDGIGDACQCGDVTDNGKVEINDATIIKRAILGLGPGLAAPLKCNVIGPTDPGGAPEKPNDCEINDSTVVKRAILGLGPGVGQVCAPAVEGA